MSPLGEYANGKSRGSTFLAGVSVRIFKSIHLAGDFYDNLLPVERGQHDKNRLDDEVLQILGPNVDAKVWLEGANFGVMYRTSTSQTSVYGLSSIGYTRVIDRYYSTVYSKKFTAFNTETVQCSPWRWSSSTHYGHDWRSFGCSIHSCLHGQKSSMDAGCGVCCF